MILRRRCIPLGALVALTFLHSLPGCTALADFPDYPLQVQSVDLGEDFACVIDTKGRVLCWGNGNNGQLGTGADSDGGQRVPVDIDRTMTALAAGQYHACAVDQSAGVWCWGDNTDGQVGSDAGSYLFSPTRVLGVPEATRLWVGPYNSCVGTHDDSIHCWGSNDSLQLTEPVGIFNSAEPVFMNDAVSGLVVKSMAIGQSHMCFLGSFGEVYCWGSNDLGQVGVGAEHASEVVCSGGSHCIQMPQQVDLGGEVLELSSWRLHTCALINGGSIRCWGENNHGQLGYTGSVIGYEPGPEVPIDNLVWKRVFVGRDHSCALDADDAMYCWGSNARGQLGVGNESLMESVDPVAVLLPSNVQDAALNDRSSCAILRGEGQLYCWGDNGRSLVDYGTPFFTEPTPIGQ